MHLRGKISFAAIGLAGCLSWAIPAPSSLGDSRFSELLEKAKAMLNDGRLAESEIILKQAYELSPSSVEVLRLLGRVEGKLGDITEAIRLFRREVEIAPGLAESHVDLAIALSDSGRYSESLDETSKALSLDRNSESAHLTRARNFMDTQRPSEARSEFAISCHLAPEDPQPYFYWALFEQQQQEFTKEITLLEKVVQLQPTNTEALMLLAHALLNVSKDSDAVVALRRVLAIDPESTEAIYMLSRALYTTSPEESRDLQKRFAALNQKNSNLDHARLLGNEAYSAATRQDWTEAIKLLRQALEECGGCQIQSKLHQDLGLAFCRSGNLRDCATELRTALAIDPTNRTAAKALAMISTPK